MAQTVERREGRPLVSVFARMDAGQALLLDVAAELARLSKSASVTEATRTWIEQQFARDPERAAAALEGYLLARSDRTADVLSVLDELGLKDVAGRLARRLDHNSEDAGLGSEQVERSGPKR
jgi:hypothetical protein